MRQLLFRLGEASDGRHYAFITDQPDIDDMFDSGYKTAYKHRDTSTGRELLARWQHTFSVKSKEFDIMPEEDALPDLLQKAFDSMMNRLVNGIDVFFCDYNLAIEADLPICNNVMDRFRSTDFVLFSCEELIGNDPTTQPYMVSYAAPRYPNSSNSGSQHRIYSKTDPFAFSLAINAIVTQRERDNLNGGHIRSEIDAYISDNIVNEQEAELAINQFVDVLSKYLHSKAAIDAK
ncbi:hypothetical protein [Marinomonas mediterranea]|jgi:hypothetical protein|uniref:Uncharacterized protein n=1 Tax=Marinomonas mediterranea (strain ATCC 700492 / JCM 21426 / NBRC 103028 / MMB-1) TaxID=717774 RepID=F2JXJ6_MARM1|nr:hypothetical protein [Marinomonas mediterranea]ADZ91896.1 hypothetical protein Marme_2665 [Marinomonas mediterranea MMB-1]WCN17984.1 hypothetical protein GV053_13485 [Marinomonas mediterranea MMB-1]